ncbi:MAG: indole-3-glycerol-phosphate synthase [Gammaproteobacteria bacterium]|nr:indole-3-glycerol-phosphate synthase [Gammaproteobacteria bacterium]|tara:strand:+ start:16017 stop:16793 length:777 start_codon:yes stop_codon:yes gene_type:complete
MLDEIIKNKEQEIVELMNQQQMNINDVLKKKIENRGFLKTIKKNIINNTISIIAEIKRASPSKGFLNENLNIEEIAIEYQQAGASCISVLTDQRFFKGSIADLIQVRNKTTLPILRKDFIIHESQLIQSKLIGADCILLIVAALKKDLFSRLYDLSLKLDLDVLVEVHDEKELQIALDKKCHLIGINNRNLKTFETSIQTSLDLIKSINDDVIVVSESGIRDSNDIKLLRNSGISTFLIGEMFVTSSNISKDLQGLII